MGERGDGVFLDYKESAPVLTVQEWDRAHEHIRNKAQSLEWRCRGRLDAIRPPFQKEVLRRAMPDLRKAFPEITEQEAFDTALHKWPMQQFNVALAPHVRREAESDVSHVDVERLDFNVRYYMLSDKDCPEWLKAFQQRATRTFNMMASVTKYNPEMINLLRGEVIKAQDGCRFDRAVMRAFAPLEKLGREQYERGGEAAEWDKQLDRDGFQ